MARKLAHSPTRPLAHSLVGELFSKLGIDWRLLLAQMLNFGILLAILTKFLYRPVLKLLDERKEKVQEALQMAKEAAEAKNQFDQWKKQELKQFRQQADQLLKEATVQGERLRAELREKAEVEAKEVLERARKDLGREKQRLFKEAEGELAALALATAERVLERSIKEEDSERLAKNAVAELSKEYLGDGG